MLVKFRPPKIWAAPTVKNEFYAWDVDGSECYSSELTFIWVYLMNSAEMAHLPAILCKHTIMQACCSKVLCGRHKVVLVWSWISTLLLGTFQRRATSFPKFLFNSFVILRFLLSRLLTGIPSRFLFQHQFPCPCDCCSYSAILWLHRHSYDNIHTMAAKKPNIPVIVVAGVFLLMTLM